MTVVLCVVGCFTRRRRPHAGVPAAVRRHASPARMRRARKAGGRAAGSKEAWLMGVAWAGSGLSFNWKGTVDSPDIACKYHFLAKGAGQGSWEIPVTLELGQGKYDWACSIPQRRKSGMLKNTCRCVKGQRTQPARAPSAQTWHSYNLEYKVSIPESILL